MSRTLVSLAGSTCLMASSILAHASCSPAVTQQIVSAQRIVDWLRPEKAGPLRVFSFDGTEYTASEAAWMKGQLRLVERECTQGNETSAALHLQQVLGVLNARRGAS